MRVKAKANNAHFFQLFTLPAETRKKQPDKSKSKKALIKEITKSLLQRIQMNTNHQFNTNAKRVLIWG